MAKILTLKCEKKFYCKFCDFGSNNKTDYNMHIMTNKHKRLILAKNTNVISQNLAKNIFMCECGKVYKHQSSLCKHKLKCMYQKDNNDDNNDDYNEESADDMKGLIVKIMKDNSEKMNFLINENNDLKNQLKEQNQQINELIPKVGNNNNNKNKFNINIFLNEKCKDALSMDQFIDKIEVSIKNLITTRDKGQPEGISNIIIENMNKLSLYERPLHCIDKKRETLYIKNNEWEKDEDKELINDALKKIESKQLKNVKKWMDEHPNYMNNQKEQEEFLKLINETTKSENENREKIVKNICNELYLDKE
jgi:hypothetical protein